MSEQYPFDFYRGHAPHVDGDTSSEAAERIEPDVARLARMVLTFIEKRAALGATCDEVEERTGLAHQTASARIRELVQEGLIFDSGARRKTRSGRNARVYLRRGQT